MWVGLSSFVSIKSRIRTKNSIAYIQSTDKYNFLTGTLMKISDQNNKIIF